MAIYVSSSVLEQLNGQFCLFILYNHIYQEVIKI